MVGLMTAVVLTCLFAYIRFGFVFVFFFFFKGKNEKFPCSMQFKKSRAAGTQHRLNSPPVGPALGLRDPPPHQAVGEKDVLFKEHGKDIPACSQASPAASSQSVPGCLVSSLQQGKRAG